ncbi:MAG TPA: anhydro-N-acetylmuramic acid kinase [Tepidisphaeraceae bacterium]|jgi:anhydro-N-acetylmuramic acid kinase
MPDRLFIGVMSGTSCDGVDAALVRVNGTGRGMRAAFLHLTSRDYSQADRGLIQSVKTEPGPVGRVVEIDRLTADHYVACVRTLLADTGTRPADVTAVAAHGQTLFHAPPLTLQAFDPSRLARGVGIDVVSDFRRADLAAGGQGAPLVPFGDFVLFRSDRPRLILNIGGIANVTVLPGGDDLDAVSGYDVGPGNCLSDWLMREHGGVDVDGGRATRGTPINSVVTAVLADPFFGRPGPKSLDTPAMIELFRQCFEPYRTNPIENLLATANAVVAGAIGREVRRLGGGELFAAGGGVHNRDLMRRIEADCGPVHTTDDVGVPAQAREATAFALLAAAFVDRFPCHMPRVTGATRPAVLGSLTPAAG